MVALVCRGCVVALVCRGCVVALVCRGCVVALVCRGWETLHFMVVALVCQPFMLESVLKCSSVWFSNFCKHDSCFIR